MPQASIGNHNAKEATTAQFPVTRPPNRSAGPSGEPAALLPCRACLASRQGRSVALPGAGSLGAGAVRERDDSREFSERAATRRGGLDDKRVYHGSAGRFVASPFGAMRDVVRMGRRKGGTRREPHRSECSSVRRLVWRLSTTFKLERVVRKGPVQANASKIIHTGEIT